MSVLLGLDNTTAVAYINNQGENSLQGIGRLGKEPMDVVPGAEHPHHSPTPTRCSECYSRCGASDYDRLVRLAAEPSHIRQDRGPIEVGMFA